MNTHPTTPPLVSIPSTATRPFQQVSCDLITDLPISSGFDSILVMVDHGLTKGVIFSSTTKTTSALDIAKIFYNRVYSRFELYNKVISDRGPQFASLFAKELGKLLGYSLSLLTAYHPQTDGETECVNQELEVYLWIFCQNDPFSWADRLPTAEFSHNHRPHSVTNVSPFYLMYGYEPRPLFSIISETLIPAAEDRIKKLSKARKEAVATHDLAHKAMKDWNSGKFTPFANGDKVWLEARNLKCLYENHKFVPKREGPFLISEVLSPITYCLSIPSKWKIHNMFHASLLSPYHENDVHGPNYTRPPPDLIGTEEEYEVEAIIAHWGSTRNRLYLVHWKGHSLAEDSWEPEANLEHVADLLRAYKKAHPKAFSPRTRTITVSHIISEMSSTRTVPYTRRLCNPACPGTLSTHCLILDDSHFASPLLMAVETDSPLFLAYQVALQAFCVENLEHYIEGHEPNIGMTRTLLRTISSELVPNILQLFDQLGGADFLYNIRNHRTSPTTRPSGGLTASPASSSSSGSPGSSPTRCRPHPTPASVSLIYDAHLPRNTRLVPLTPTPAGPATNPIEVESYHASASSDEVDAERSFRVDPYSLACTIEFAEEERISCSPIVLGLLLSWIDRFSLGPIGDSKRGCDSSKGGRDSG